MTKNNKKPKKWRKRRHGILKGIAAAVLYPVAKFKYGMQLTKFENKQKRPYLVMYNHQTTFDQFFVGLCIKGPIYYLASEDLFSNGFISKLLKFAVEPIPIKKSVTDVRATMNCIRVAREGGTIALSPEGNRTYSGKTEYIKPSTAALVRALKLPVAFLHIEGGYGVQPRWSDKVRKGKVKVYVKRVLEYEEYKDLSDEQIFEIIQSELHVDERDIKQEYKHKKLAEYLERVMYICPDCGLSRFESKNDVITCKKCGARIQYLPNKLLQGLDKPFPFANATEWYDYQEQFIHKLDLNAFGTDTIFSEKARLFEVKLYHKKICIDKNATISSFNDRIEVAYVRGNEQQVLVLPYEKLTAISVLGRNKLNIYIGDKLWQIKGDKHFNPVKYMHIYYHAVNLQKYRGENEFLGL
jgi:1-acyl-sn-glycerol-3-phosphate acyltransferase